METTFRRTALRFWIGYAAYTAIYIARLNLSIASPELVAAGVLNAAQVGVLGSVFSVVYAAGRLFNGTLSDRAMPWVMICTGLAAAGGSNLLAGLMPPFAAMVALWGVNAYAQSMLWSSELCVVCALYPPAVAKRRTAWLVTAVAVGNLLGILANTWLVNAFGARMAFVVPGALNLAMSPLVFAAIRRVKPLPARGAAHVSPLGLLRRRDVRIMLAPGMLHGVMKDNISLWMAMYFVRRFGIELRDSLWFMLMIPAVGLVGRVLYGAAYRLCGERENAVSRWGFVLCAAAALALTLPGISPVLAAVGLSLIYAAVSMINTSMLSIYPMRFAESGNVASLSGIMDFATYLGAGIGAAAFGLVIDRWGYEAMFASWAAISAISIAALAWMDRGSRAGE